MFVIRILTRLIAERGIAAYHGFARFKSPDTIDVAGEALEAGHIVIASGARPAGLGFSGADHVMTSDGFLELEALPRRIVFLGGGYIAAELAHVAARAGANVTVPAARRSYAHAVRSRPRRLAH